MARVQRKMFIDSQGIRRVCMVISDDTKAYAIMQMDIINFDGTDSWMWFTYEYKHDACFCDVDIHTTKAEALQQLELIFGVAQIKAIMKELQG